MSAPKPSVLLGLGVLVVSLACAPSLSDGSDGREADETDQITEVDDLMERAARALDDGDTDTAYDAYATAVVSGADLTGLFYALLHGEDPNAALRHYVGISRELLDRRSELDPDARTRADAFLCDESLGLPVEECTPEAVRQRLALLDQQLGASNPE